MHKAIATLLLAATPVLSHASDCSIGQTAAAAPLQPTVLTAISPELIAPVYRPGAQGGVLSPAFDETQSLEQVVLRMRLEGCSQLASAMPAPAAIDPNDPSVYKPQTEFDNTPWRFDMQQGGKMMTADEFDAWMKARGVRVARGAPKPATPALDIEGVPAATATGEAAGTSGAAASASPD
ncbi:hypothetical protein [Luteimonas huabeiensis]|uniref:hypothetical protein n=1 Tax=Luteimonas huabeiensis TaxID=1244513 RepID=UPI000467CAF6|nr:hypothetical protein [Luteimonas huabeiensis]